MERRWCLISEILLCHICCLLYGAQDFRNKRQGDQLLLSTLPCLSSGQWAPRLLPTSAEGKAEIKEETKIEQEQIHISKYPATFERCELNSWERVPWETRLVLTDEAWALVDTV